MTAWGQVELMKAEFAITSAFASPTGGVEVALFTASPGRAGTQTSEISGTGYAAATLAPSAWIDPVPTDDGLGGYVEVVNRHAIAWQVGADWGASPIQAIGVRDPVSGELVWFFDLETPVDVSSPGAIVIPAEALVARLRGDMDIPGEGSALMQYAFGKGSSPLSRPSGGVFVAQVTADPGYAGTLVEVTGTGYSRRPISASQLEVVDDGVGARARLQTGQSIVFAATGDDWTGPWTHAVFCRASVGDNPLLYAQHSAPVTPPPSGQSHSMSGGNLSWRLV